MNDIVVGIDRSPTARRAAERAAAYATALGANLHVVMTIERTASTAFAIGSETYRVDPIAEAEQFLVEVARTLACERTTHATPYGDPAKALCSEAKRLNATAIVVGNRRAQGVSRVLGSVASAVVRSAPCDVLIANTTVD